MYIQNINIGWHEQDPERLDPPLVWSPNSEKQVVPCCNLAQWPVSPGWPRDQQAPCRGGTSVFPERPRPPAGSPRRPSRRWPRRSARTTASSSGRRERGTRGPPRLAWVLGASPDRHGCCNISMTCTMRESMLIWSSKMAVTTEMRKSARNLALMWSHFVGIRFSYTFLDGALQSGQRSKDLDLPTSDSSSPSASNNQFNSTSTTGTSATRISTNGTSISSSVNALPWVLTNSTTASRSPSPEQIGWQRILAFPWEKMCFCISNKNNHPGSREITFGVSNVILLISASCTAYIRWKVLFCFVCCLFALWW